MAPRGVVDRDCMKGGREGVLHEDKRTHTRTTVRLHTLHANISYL
jgi:hypothetical protein